MGDNYCSTVSLDLVEEQKDREAVDYIFPEDGPVRTFPPSQRKRDKKKNKRILEAEIIRYLDVGNSDGIYILT